MPSPDYLPLALDLPAVYQEDQVGFDQVDAYLGLADALAREHLQILEDAELALSPEGLTRWPPGLATDAGADALVAAHRATQDELAAWTGFTFPRSWTDGPTGLELRREYLRRAAAIWRRRATPGGLVDWFSLAFGHVLPDGTTPQLVEHFRVADPTDAECVARSPWLRATLFVPGTEDFAAIARRREAIAFVDRYAPAHVLVRVCWVDPAVFRLPEPPTRDSSATQIAAWQADMRTILCSFISFVDHANAVRVWECIDAGRAEDRLGAGRLPGAGTTPPNP
jgi:hypothetical protein